MAFRARYRKNWQVVSVMRDLFFALIALYFGDILFDVGANLILDQCGALYSGLTVLGFTYNSDGCISSVSGASSAGILTIIGVLAILKVITNFVDISW